MIIDAHQNNYNKYSRQGEYDKTRVVTNFSCKKKAKEYNSSIIYQIITKWNIKLL